MLRKSFYMVLAIMLISSISLFAQDCKSKTSSCASTCNTVCPTTTSHVSHDDVVEAAQQTPWNKVCPVMGKEVTANTATYTLEGKVWGFCCPPCIDKFKADPKKYIGNVSADGKKFIGKKS